MALSPAVIENVFTVPLLVFRKETSMAPLVPGLVSVKVPLLIPLWVSVWPLVSCQ